MFKWIFLIFGALNRIIVPFKTHFEFYAPCPISQQEGKWNSFRSFM